jgi:hypothetical protein
MGRAALPKPVSKHRRQILRTIRGDAYAHSHVYAGGNCDPNSDANSNCDVNTCANRNTHASSNTYTKNSPDPEKSADTSPAPVVWLSAGADLPIIARTVADERQQVDPLRRGASTVKVERSAVSNTFTAHSER